MKKTLTILLIMVLLAGTFPTLAYGALTLENPKDIIIAQPGLEYTTGSSRVSILGASDWDHPITLNGRRLETTAHGFFAEYVNLAVGTNTFVLANNGKTKAVRITYKPPVSSGGSDNQPFDASRYLYLQGSDPVYGVVKVNNGTRAWNNLEENQIMVPVAKGMKAQIIGEDKNFYMLSDWSFVYKSAMDKFSGEVAPNDVTAISVRDNPEFNSAEVALAMKVNALYDYSFDGNRLVLTLYGTRNLAPISLNDNHLVSKITPIVTTAKNACAYEILLDKGSITNGVYLEYREGEMILGFKRVPAVTGEGLSQVTIFLDAGHGGTDPGALGPLSTFGPMEKDINLSIASYAAEFLRGKGARLIETREDDSAVSLAARMGTVADFKPDLSLSIHANATAVSNDYSKAKGYRVYYTYGLPVTGEEDAVAFIGRRAAELMGLAYDGPRQSNLALGRNMFCPSMIFEVGFMSNPGDYEWLLEEKNRKTAGEAIGMATLEWFQQLSAMEAYDRDQIKVFVGLEKLAFDVEPFIEAGRTLVPMRRIFEALGASVLWNEQEQSVTVLKEEQKIVFKIGEKGYIINEIEKTMEVSAKIVEGGRTVVPLRVLSEALGYVVDWDGETRTIQIN